MPRYDTLPGVGRIRCYDAGPRFVDRYTVLFEDMDVYDGTSTTPTKPKPYGIRQALALSGSPSHPQGVSLWIETPPPMTYGKGSSHRRIAFSALPANVQAHIIERTAE